MKYLIMLYVVDQKMANWFRNWSNTVIILILLVQASQVSLAVAQSNTHRVPGAVIAHSYARTGIYLGSPSIVILGDGTLVMSHDTFGPNSKANEEEVFNSRDRGASWSKVATVGDQYYSSLFVHRGVLYLLGTSKLLGFAVIRRSTDGGKTWSNARDASSGVLATDGKYFSSALPVVAARGRLWKAIEVIDHVGIVVKMMSADVNSDLLNASSWTLSNGLTPDKNWLDGKFGGWLEGNAVATPSGAVVDVLRVYYNFLPEKAAIVSSSDDGTHINFDPAHGFIDLPGGGKKFTIRYDPSTKLYWSLTNAVLPGSYNGNNLERARNTLALVSSTDLRSWEVRRVVLHSDDADKHGFQYVDWVFDNHDIAAVVRTAFDDDDGGAHSQHDSNFITFLRVPNYASN
ncbi:glycoside hydrolase [Paraburkholderia fungorum]|nr:sialidase family protein [Paraburkholderia fungorum]USU20967.1 glycoside hydrolase [Paraburkholderia fungorum]USU27037.1 glycoside hydrolase [Paraburkholderia fungorum]